MRIRGRQRGECQGVFGLPLCCLACILALTPRALAEEDGTRLRVPFADEVDRRLEVPPDEQHAYGNLVTGALADKPLTQAQYVVIVDRSPRVQAAMIYWMSADRIPYFIGASPVSTGKPGSFDHFTTPLGVFEHTTNNPDFRAEGTKNKLGIRGYGRKGMRVFDFGWQTAERGWGGGGESTMRLHMHATDPDILESRLGTIQSKGCVRIPATLNTFLDHYAILDGDYEQDLVDGKSYWVLSSERDPTPWSGRYLVIVETQRAKRPAWALPPKK